MDISILTKTFDSMPTGVGIFHVPDLDDVKSIRYVYMNRIILHEMRKNKEEVHGKKVIEVAPEAFEHEGGIQVLETYRKVAREGGVIDLGLVKYSNELVKGIYECSVHYIEKHYVYVMLNNVTQSEKVKNTLRAKNKHLSQYARIVAHDLKEPIRSVRNFTELLKRNAGSNLDDKTNERINQIIESSTRMYKSVEGLLELNKLHSSKSKKEIDCNILIEAVIIDLDSRIKNSGADIQVENLPTVKGYETELLLLFQNLINNAIKFVSPGEKPVVKISCTEDEDYEFAISDNGIGISEENQSKIFQEFVRTRNTEKYEGTGIGLSICKRVVDMHGGRIWIESTEGEGSTFYFSIPKTE